MKISAGVAFILVLALVVAAPSDLRCEMGGSMRDVELLTLVAGSEARGPNEGPEYVIHVILNRADDKRWPDTIEGVVTQPYQFSTVHLNDNLQGLLNHPNRIEREAWRRIHGLAKDIFCGGREENPLPDVYHFLAPQEFNMTMDPITRQVIDVGRGPSWALGMYVHPVSDGLRHWFLYEPRKEDG